MKSYISAILIPCLLLEFTHCVSSNYVTKDKFLLDAKEDYNIITNNDSVYILKENQYTVLKDTIHFVNGPIYFNPYNVDFIPLSDVKQYEIKEVNESGTIFLVTISVIVIGCFLLVSRIKNLNLNF